MGNGSTDSGAGGAMGHNPQSGRTPRHDTVLERSVSAPRALVFAAWTDPQHLAQWWGPHGFTNPVCRFDPRPGGEIYIEMRGPDGSIYPMTGSVREIKPPSRLVFVSSALDNANQPLFEVETTVDFFEAAGDTTVRVKAHVLNASESAELMLSGMEEGWGQTLDRLASYVAELQNSGAGR